MLAAIDVGTNACRLLIAVPRGQRALRVIDSYAVNVRLGEDLERTGALAGAALDRTIAALKICAARLTRHGVTHVRAIATEACRRAANTADLLSRAEKEAGIRLAVVSPEEEARLAATGCLPLIEDKTSALVFDIGGGSTELILVREGAIFSWASAPIGVVSLAERHGGHRVPASAYPLMRAHLAEAFGPLHERIGSSCMNGPCHLLGTSGTLTTLAGIKLGLKRYDRNLVDGQWLTRDEVLGIAEDIVSKDFEARAAVPCIGRDRADLILPGCAILLSIMERWPCARLRVADRGLREGVLLGLLAEALTEPCQAPVPMSDAGRLNAH